MISFKYTWVDTCDQHIGLISWQKISSLQSSLGSGGRISLGGSGPGMKIGSLGTPPIKPTISMVTTKTGNTQTVTLVQKPATGISSGPTQKIVSVNRPVFKVTPGPPGRCWTSCEHYCVVYRHLCPGSKFEDVFKKYNFQWNEHLGTVQYEMNAYLNLGQRMGEKIGWGFCK